MPEDARVASEASEADDGNFTVPPVPESVVDALAQDTLTLYVHADKETGHPLVACLAIGDKVEGRYDLTQIANGDLDRVATILEAMIASPTTADQVTVDPHLKACVNGIPESHRALMAEVVRLRQIGAAPGCFDSLATWLSDHSDAIIIIVSGIALTCGAYYLHNRYSSDDGEEIDDMEEAEGAGASGASFAIAS